MSGAVCCSLALCLFFCAFFVLCLNILFCQNVMVLGVKRDEIFKKLEQTDTKDSCFISTSTDVDQPLYHVETRINLEKKYILTKTSILISNFLYLLSSFVLETSMLFHFVHKWSSLFVSVIIKSRKGFTFTVESTIRNKNNFD